MLIKLFKNHTKKKLYLEPMTPSKYAHECYLLIHKLIYHNIITTFWYIYTHYTRIKNKDKNRI